MNAKLPERASSGLSRRRFLQAIGAVGFVAGVGGVGDGSPDGVEGADLVGSQALDPSIGSLTTGEHAAGEHQWAFVVDLRLCDGCDKCTEACQKAHYLSPDQKWINVYHMTSSSGQEYAMPRLCMQCENPPCLKVCPVGATFKNDEGLVLVDQNICIGCRMCMAACPYEARYFNWDQPPPGPEDASQPMPEFPVPQQQGTVGKCILCTHYTREGKLPACVEGCPMGALYIGDLVADVATNGAETVKLSSYLRENDAVRMKEELGTRPRVFYILGHGQDYTY